MKIVLLEPLGIPAEVLAHYQARLRPKAIPWFVTGADHRPGGAPPPYRGQ